MAAPGRRKLRLDRAWRVSAATATRRPARQTTEPALGPPRRASPSRSAGLSGRCAGKGPRDKPARRGPHRRLRLHGQSLSQSSAPAGGRSQVAASSVSKVRDVLANRPRANCCGPTCWTNIPPATLTSAQASHGTPPTGPAGASDGRQDHVGRPVSCSAALQRSLWRQRVTALQLGGYSGLTTREIDAPMFVKGLFRVFLRAWSFVPRRV
jgi:hypothetical protein